MKISSYWTTYGLSLTLPLVSQSFLLRNFGASVNEPSNKINVDSDIHSASNALEESRRIQAEQEIGIAPLTCNLNSTGEYLDLPCTNWEDAFETSTTDEVVIPCGECYTMASFSNGEELNLGGLNILGQLKVPDGSDFTIKTPYVFVQGLLEMHSYGEVGETEKIKIILTGDDDVNFTPLEDTSICPSSGCNVGSRPIVVAGGKMDVHGLPESCPSWGYSRHISTVVEFVNATDSFVGFEQQPIFFDFTNDIGTWFGNLGAKAEHVDDGINPHLRVYDRIASWQGPFFDIPVATRNMMSVEHSYVWSAKIKLSRPDGQPINCIAQQTDCPSLDINRMTDSDQIGWFTKESNILIPAADTWEEIGGVLRYTESEISEDHIFSAFTFRGPEAGVEIYLDDFKMTNRDMQLAVENSLAGVSVCENLVQNGNGDEYADRQLTIPFTSWFRNETLTLETEDNGNNYFFLEDRHVPYSTIKFNIETGCTVEGAKYEFSMKVQLNSVETIIPRVMMKILNPEGSDRRISFDLIARCEPANQNMGWVNCYRSEYTFTEIHQQAEAIEILVVTPGDNYSPIKYDDISFTPYTGVKLPRSTNGCWGPQSEVLFASKGSNGQEQIATITSSVDGSIDFSTSIDMPTPASDDENFATEIALLSRNIAFESDSASSGGHLMVLKTSSEQRIEGVAFKGFGQEGVPDRFPINFHMAGESLNSRISRNVIRDSHQRCIVLSGTSKLKVLENVSYNTKGHCYVLQDGSEENNILYRNLGALTTPLANVIDGESDYDPATFYITNPDNKFIENVAAGSAGTGFWFHLEPSVTGESAGARYDVMYDTIDPSGLRIQDFRNNVAHSNSIGLKTFPGQFSPSERSTFTNSIIYRNSEKGMYFHQGKNVQVDGGVVADNPIGIDVEFADNVMIRNIEIKGSSGYTNPCPTQQESLIGIKISGNNNDPTLAGTSLEDIIFRNINDSRCASAVGALLNQNRLTDVFNSQTAFARLHFEDVETRFSACDALNSGLQRMRIEDNGSMNPNGNYIGHIVSNDLIGDYVTCEALDACTSYCYDQLQESNDCNRDVTIYVSPDSDAGTQLGIYDGTNTVYQGGSVPQTTKLWDGRREFTASLSPGQYTISFWDASTTTEVWPLFTEVVYGDEPRGCTHFLESLDIFTPNANSDVCNNLLTNGNFDQGDAHWYHNGCGLNLVGGYSGSALSTTDRENSLEGMAQFLDTRCMVNGTKYEVKAKVKMSADGTTPTCSYEKIGAGEDHCPRVNIKSSIQGETSHVDLGVAKVNLPWETTEWNYIYGSFTVNEHMVNADSVALYFDGPEKDYDIIVDDVEVYSYDSICDDLATNGNFYEGTKDWSFIGAETGITLVPGVQGNALSTIDRTQWFHGMVQQIDTRCVVEENVGKIYEVTADVKLQNVGDGTPTDCDPFVFFFSERSCPAIALRLMARDNGALQELREIGQPIGPWPTNGGWGKIQGTFEMTSDIVYGQTTLNYMFLKAWAGINIIVDNVSIQEITPTDPCLDLIKNGDAETGDARDWFIKGSGNVGQVEMISPGASGNYAIRHYGNRAQLFNGLMQKIDRQCMAVNSNWEISFKIKLFDQNGSGVVCDKSLGGFTGTGEENCPEVYIESRTQNGGTKITSLTNEHPAPTWFANDWNEFKAVFTMLRSHRILDETFIFIHKIKIGYSYIIDDFKMVPYAS